MVLVQGAAFLELVEEGPTAGNELRQHGLKTLWIIRLGDTSSHGRLHDFANKFCSLHAVEANGGFVVQDPEYGAVHFNGDATVEAQGRVLDPRGWTVTGSRVNLPDGPLGSE
jgi:hypothetical protein